MMVVFPAPLWPTIRVRGLKKVMTCLLSGSKLRIPLMSILSTVLIFALVFWFTGVLFDEDGRRSHAEEEEDGRREN